MITIGADPEIFVSKGGKFVSAHGLVPGTKDSPHKVDKGAVQVDGLALEFNVDPEETYEQFQDNIDSVMSTLKSMVPDHDFLDVAAVVLSQEDKESIPPESLVIGCNPDLNVYTQDVNESPDADSNIRAAGGHIHIGGIFSEDDSDEDKWNKALQLGKLMDKHVGVYSLMWDKDDLRRTIYGKAGSCRIKSYGIEYRSLSNKWLFSPDTTKFVFEGTKKAVQALENGEIVTTDLYRNIIDSSDRGNDFFKQVA